MHKGGRTLEQIPDFIESNLNYYLNINGRIIIGNGSGTCDFTDKLRNFVKLSKKKVADIISQHDRIFSICKPFGDIVKVVILEIPYYSIKMSNKHLGTTVIQTVSILGSWRKR